MEERITIKEFITIIPTVKNKVTVIMFNTLIMLMYGEDHRKRKFAFDKLDYIDEVTKDKFLSVPQTGQKTWIQFCLYRDNYKAIKQYKQLMNEIQLDIK